MATKVEVEQLLQSAASIIGMKLRRCEATIHDTRADGTPVSFAINMELPGGNSIFGFITLGPDGALPFVRDVAHNLMQYQ